MTGIEKLLDPPGELLGVRMQRVLHAWDEHLAHPSLPRTLAPALRSAGFEDVEMTAHSFATADLHPDAARLARVLRLRGARRRRNPAARCLGSAAR